MKGSSVSEAKGQKTERRGDEGTGRGLRLCAACQGLLDVLHFWAPY